MATIGLINLLMRANSDPFTKDLKKAGDSVSSFKKEAGSAGGTLASFSGGLKMAAGALTAVGAALGVAAAAKGLKDFVSSSLDSVDATSKMATRLGTTTEALIGLQHAANLNLDDAGAQQFGETLSQMQQAIGDVSLDDEGKAKDVLKILGLDAQTLKNQDPVQNFNQIADAISKIDSKAEKLNIAKKLFGGSGQALLPMLESGSAGLKELADDADNLGLSFSNVDGAKVEMANDAMSRAGAVITGIGQQLAIGLAPYIKAAADALADFGAQGIDVAGYVETGMDIIGTSVGTVADVFQILQLAISQISAVFFEVVADVLGGIADMADGIEHLINLIPGVEVEFGDGLRQMADDAMEFADTNWEEFQKAMAVPPPSEAIDAFFENIQTSADKMAQEMADAAKPVKSLGDSFTGAALKVGELEEKLREQIATFGKSSAEVEIYKLKVMGATDEQLAGVKKLSDQLKAKQIIESNMTPLEKYRKELGELQELVKNGSIDQTTFSRAKAKLGKETGVTEVKFASAVKFGSDEARQTVLRHQGLGNQDPQKAVEKNTAAIAKDSSKQTDLLAKIVAAVQTDVQAFNFN